jgi:hypothetical protein
MTGRLRGAQCVGLSVAGHLQPSPRPPGTPCVMTAWPPYGVDVKREFTTNSLLGWW